MLKNLYCTQNAPAQGVLSEMACLQHFPPALSTKIFSIRDLRSPQDGMGKLHPQRRTVGDRVHDHELPGDNRRQCVAVYAVDAAAHDQVTRHSENDQQVHSGIKKDRRENARGEASERRCTQGAAGN